MVEANKKLHAAQDAKRVDDMDWKRERVSESMIWPFAMCWLLMCRTSVDASLWATSLVLHVWYGHERPELELASFSLLLSALVALSLPFTPPVALEEPARDDDCDIDEEGETEGEGAGGEGEGERERAGGQAGGGFGLGFGSSFSIRSFPRRLYFSRIYVL